MAHRYPDSQNSFALNGWVGLTPRPDREYDGNWYTSNGGVPFMNAIKAFCPNCGVIERTVAQQIGGKITFGLAGAALGTRAVKDPMVSLICALGLTSTTKAYVPVGRLIGSEGESVKFLELLAASPRRLTLFMVRTGV